MPGGPLVAPGGGERAGFWRSGRPGARRYELTRRRRRRPERRYFFSLASLPSFGAPVPDEPRNSLLPFAKVTSRPFPFIDLSFARKPSTKISVPGSSEALVNPRLSRLFGGPPSIIQRSTLPSV